MSNYGCHDGRWGNPWGIWTYIYRRNSDFSDCFCAINGTQLLVKFNKAVDETTATSPASYSFSDRNSVASAELQQDGKSVVLTLTNAYNNQSKHTVAVTIDGVILDGTVDTTFPIFTSVVSIDDQVKASISKVTSVTNSDKATSLTVDFSEPIASGATFKVDGVSASAPYSAGATSVTVSVPSGLAVGTTHKVEVVNLTDLAGNVDSVASKEFTVTKDVVAPTVSSVVAQGDNQLLVTFSKDMKNDSAAQTVLANNIKVKNDVFNDVGVTSVTPVKNADGTDSKKQFIVQLDRTDAANLFTSTKTSHNLTILFVNDTIQDYLGNTLAGVTTTATISKDSVAPEVTGVTYKKNSAGKVTDVVVNFSEGLKANAALAFPATLVNENGVVVNTSSVLTSIGTANVAAGAKTATFHLGTAQTVTGKYTVAFAAGWVKDTSLAYNDSKAYTTIVDFGATKTDEIFTIPATNVTNGGTNVIKVVFPEAVKGGATEGSATDASRYSINGKALPAGTTITLNAVDSPTPGTAAQTIATITLPADSVDKTDNAAIFTINGVKTLTGKTNVSFTKALTITDNVAPVLSSARVLDNKHIELTYNEDLTGSIASALVGDEFLISQGTNTFALTDGQLTASNVPGYANKLVLTINKSIGTTAPASVGTVTASKTGTSASVTGTYSGTSDKNYSVAVKTVDGTSGEATVITVDGTDINESVAGNHTFALGNGLTINVSKGTGTLAQGDTFTFTATAATTATPVTLDLTKDYTIKTLVPTSTTVDVKDVAQNGQKGNVVVNIAK